MRLQEETGSELEAVGCCKWPELIGRCVCSVLYQQLPISLFAFQAQPTLLARHWSRHLCMLPSLSLTLTFWSSMQNSSSLCRTNGPVLCVQYASRRALPDDARSPAKDDDYSNYKGSLSPFRSLLMKSYFILHGSVVFFCFSPIFLRRQRLLGRCVSDSWHENKPFLFDAALLIALKNMEHGTPSTIGETKK